MWKPIAADELIVSVSVSAMAESFPPVAERNHKTGTRDAMARYHAIHEAIDRAGVVAGAADEFAPMMFVRLTQATLDGLREALARSQCTAVCLFYGSDPNAPTTPA